MRSGFPAFVMVLAAAAASAADGTIEINQARALMGSVTTGDIPGFPVDLTTPGRYVLTSDLDVPTAVDGLVIHVPGVTIDLNGKRISSTFVCGNSCGLGDGLGITSVDGRAKVIDGEVSGFAFGGVDLGPLSHVQGLLVSAIGGDAIALGSSSIALANRISSVGKSGLSFKGPQAGIYRDNLVVSTERMAAAQPRWRESPTRRAATSAKTAPARPAAPAATTGASPARAIDQSRQPHALDREHGHLRPAPRPLVHRGLNRPLVRSDGSRAGGEPSVR